MTYTTFDHWIAHWSWFDDILPQSTSHLNAHRLVLFMVTSLTVNFGSILAAKHHDLHPYEAKPISILLVWMFYSRAVYEKVDYLSLTQLIYLAPRLLARLIPRLRLLKEIVGDMTMKYISHMLAARTLEFVFLGVI